MSHGRGHLSKGRLSSGRLKTVPLSSSLQPFVYLSATLLGTCAPPTNTHNPQGPVHGHSSSLGFCSPFVCCVLQIQQSQYGWFPLWSRFSNFPKVGVPDSPCRGRGEWLAGMKWAESTWKALLHRNLPHLHILLIKASVELLRRG